MKKELISELIKGLAGIALAGNLYLASEIQGADKNKISQKGIDLIKQYEGYSARVYLDSAGKSTIGYGHLIRSDESLDQITEYEAEKILRKDIERAEKAVQKSVKAPLTQNQYDALVSFTYNLGEGSLKQSTLLRKLNNSDYNGAKNEFAKWVYAGGKRIKGLENRRKKESELFLSP
ncbi:MAG: lysozyme [Nanoarchaeota archaeon]